MFFLQVNLEKLDDKHALKRTILGNFALSQFQSIICGLIASCVACLSDLLFKNHFVASHLLILTGASVFTASLTSLLLGKTDNNNNNNTHTHRTHNDWHFLVLNAFIFENNRQYAHIRNNYGQETEFKPG